MSVSLEKIVTAVEGHDDAVLCGTMYFVYECDKETVSGNNCRQFTPAIKDLCIKLSDEVIATFEDAELPDLDSLVKEICEVDTYQRFVHKIPYTYSRLYGKDDNVDPDAPMEVPLSLVARITELEKEARKLMMDQVCKRRPHGMEDEDVRRNAFERFKLKTPFIDNPCDMDFFIEMAEEYRASDYFTLGLPEYYNWYFKSLKLLDGNGELSVGTAKTASRMLAAWHDAPEEEQRYWMTRNLEVHPRHDEIYHRFIAENRDTAWDAKEGVNER